MKHSKFKAMFIALFGILIIPPLAAANDVELQPESRAFHPPLSVHNANYGRAVDVEGEWLAVGVSSLHDPTLLPSVFSIGGVEMYRRTPNGWELHQVLYSPDPFFSGQFGERLAMSGDTIAIGEPSYGFVTGTPPGDVGRISVFKLVGGQWEFVQYLRGFNPYGFVGLFGYIMDMDAGWVVVGQPNEYPHQPGLYEVGAVNCYQEQSDGSWILAQKIPPPSPAVGALGSSRFFGTKVRVKDDLMLVKARSGSGWVFAYRNINGTWEFEAEFWTSVGPGFGSSPGLAIDGDQIAIGMMNWLGGNQNQNAVVVYEKQAGTWMETGRITPPGEDQMPADLPLFGVSLDMSGDQLVVGAPGGREVEAWNIGYCHLFERNALGEWHEQGRYRHSDRDPSNVWGGAHLGFQVAADFENGWLTSTAHGYGRFGPGGPSGSEHIYGGAYLFDLILGNPICDVDANSTGQVGELSVTGSREVADGRLALHGYRLPPGEFALCLYGQASGEYPVLTGGKLCVLGGAVERLLPALTIGDSGEIYFDVDLSVPVHMANLLPGTAWAFQVFHRDVVGGLSTTNTSTAMRVVLE